MKLMPTIQYILVLSDVHIAMANYTKKSVSVDYWLRSIGQPFRVYLDASFALSTLP